MTFQRKPSTPPGRGVTPGLGRDAKNVCLNRIAAAQLIGWPALEESWRRTLAEVEARTADKLAA